MKKILLVIFFSYFLFSCNQNDKYVTELENQIKELNEELDNAYKPGFGILMGNIQIHHAKLWFSGKNSNWKLAEFQRHEIQERFEDLEKYQADKQEVKYIPMIEPVLDSLKNNIQEKNVIKFEKNFRLLTNTCNSCHNLSKHEYIEIKIPDFESNFNQEFKPNK